MMRKSPMRRPMQKITDLASSAAASASAAAAQGTRLSSAVASRVETAVRSPEKGRRRSSAGIRDRIKKFDLASKNNVGERHNRHQWTRLRHRAKQQQQRNEVREPTSPIAAAPQEGEDYPPCNPIYREKENEVNKKYDTSPGYAHSFTSKEGIKNLSPAFRGMKTKHGVDGVEISCVNPRYRADKSDFKGIKKSPPRQNGGSRHQPLGQSKRKFECLESVSADIADLNRAAVLDPSSITYEAAKSKHDDTTKTKKSFGVPIARKRTPSIDHPLIQSPLTKHIRSVHSSACSNATVTVIKDPFPLLTPQGIAAERPLAAVAGWEKDGDDIMLGRLDALGAVVTGGRSYACKSTADETRKGETNDSNGSDASDLLTAAGFLFKHSRRKLG